MSLVNLFSSAALIAVSFVPFYFASKVYRVRKMFFLLSLVLGLALLIHGLHHTLEFAGMIVLSLALGLASALLAVLFALLYYISWRSTSAES